jgi:hypothetical protein
MSSELYARFDLNLTSVQASFPTSYVNDYSHSVQTIDGQSYLISISVARNSFGFYDLTVGIPTPPVGEGVTANIDRNDGTGTVPNDQYFYWAPQISASVATASYDLTALNNAVTTGYPRALYPNWVDGLGVGDNYDAASLTATVSGYAIVPDGNIPSLYIPNFYASNQSLNQSYSLPQPFNPAPYTIDSVVYFPEYVWVDIGPAPTQAQLTGQIVLTAATEHVALPDNTTIATFTDSNTSDVQGDFAATIDWGDGTTTSGRVTGSNGSFTVSGGHTYAGEGTPPVSVTITGNNTSISPTGNVVVGENDVLTAQSLRPIDADPTLTVSGTLAAFTDTDTISPAGDFTASIDWGDGTTGTGTVSGANGSFTVSGSHTYAPGTTGQDTVAVTLTDNAPGTATVTANTTINFPTVISITANQTTISENSVDQPIATFTISLSQALSSPITVGYATADGTATAGQDYTGITGQVTIPTGKQSATVEVQTRSDGKFTPDGETFSLLLTGVTTSGQDVTFSNTSAEVTIVESLTHVADWNGDGHPVGFTGTYQQMESKYNALVQIRNNTQDLIQTSQDDEQTQINSMVAATGIYAAKAAALAVDLAGLKLPRAAFATINTLVKLTSTLYDLLVSAATGDVVSVAVAFAKNFEDQVSKLIKYVGNVTSVVDFANTTNQFAQTISSIDTAITTDKKLILQQQTELHTLQSAITDIGGFISQHLETDIGVPPSPLQIQGGTGISSAIQPAGTSQLLLTQSIASLSASTSGPDPSLALLTQYMASSFVTDSNGHGNPLITDSAPGQQPFLTHPHT